MEIIQSNSVSPELEVPMILIGLNKIYGKKLKTILKKALDVDSMNDFIRYADKFQALIQFYENEREHVLKKRYQMNQIVNSDEIRLNHSQFFNNF